METSSCPGVFLKSWRPFEGEGAEAAAAAALGGTSISLANPKTKLNIFAAAKCSTGAGLKSFQREIIV